MLALDVHFYVSLIGTECDKGNGTKPHLIDKLLSHTGLNQEEANLLIDTMLQHNKLVDNNGKLHCTIK